MVRAATETTTNRGGFVAMAETSHADAAEPGKGAEFQFTLP
jgi:hypothetical protein